MAAPAENPSFTRRGQAGAVRALICLLPLAACHPPATPFVAAAAVDVAAIATFGRGTGDMVVSLVSGRDCSVVRLDRGLSYCRPVAPPPPPPRFCTRTLGLPECWADPAALLDRPAPLADGRATLTEAQEANRTASWP